MNFNEKQECRSALARKRGSAEVLKTITILGVAIILYCFTGCKENIDKPKSSEKQPAAQAELPKPKEPLNQEPPRPAAIPSVTLTAVKINEDYANNVTWIDIRASGTFLYNIVQKESPERIIIVLHNTIKGKAPEKITVNNGTVDEVKIDELNPGKGAAVRMTISLTRKTVYGAHPSNGTLKITIPRKT